MNAEAKTLAARPRFFFDTEFIEDGKTIELISIGIAAEDGRTYYAEVEGVDYSRADPWLHENVFPHLTGATKAREQIAADVAAFVGEKPEFWAYYADYDWVALCQLYGRMIDLPKGWPMFCRDVKQLCVSLGDPKLPKQTTTEHHALADAIDTMAKWHFLDRLSAPVEGVGLTGDLPRIWLSNADCDPRDGRTWADTSDAWASDEGEPVEYVRADLATAALAAKDNMAALVIKAEQALSNSLRDERDALKAALAELEAANEEVKDATTREIERQRDEATALVERLRGALKDCIEDYEDAANYKSDYLREKHGDAASIAKYRALLSEPQASEGRDG